MITAIPMNENRVASHFTKADTLLFINEQGVEISRHANPALNANCAGKQSLLELLSAEGAERVVVRNIGEQMLGKLLARQLAVLQTECGRRQASELAAPSAEGLRLLTEASQGRQSLNHEAKAKSGGCGCGGQEAAGQSCCQAQGEAQGPCQHDHTHAPGHEHKPGAGRRRCCHS